MVGFRSENQQRRKRQKEKEDGMIFDPLFVFCESVDPKAMTDIVATSDNRSVQRAFRLINENSPCVLRGAVR
jgi:hypothetical protein